MSVKRAMRGKARRSAALNALANGQYNLRETLREGHVHLETCPVYKVLMATPGMGHQKTRDTLERAHIWPLTELGHLTDAQRQAVIDNLPGNIK